jgi:predicted DNA-binding transcriptional regulator
MDTKAIDDLKFVSEVRRQMNENELMLSYRGKMSQEIVMALLNLTENKLTQSETDDTSKSRVFCVMVECLQNITQHSEKDHHAESSMFMIGQSEKEFVIYSGNVIKKEKVQELKDKLSKLNMMTDDELKGFYKYWMMNETISKKPGFGLGLIHIARFTGNPLDFDFELIDSDHYFFSLKTKVIR